MTSPVLGTNASMCAFIPLYSTSVSIRTSGLSASALSISAWIAVPIIAASFNSPSLVSGWSLSLYQTLRRQPPTSDGPICTCVERDRLASPARSASSNNFLGSVIYILSCTTNCKGLPVLESRTEAISTDLRACRLA